MRADRAKAVQVRQSQAELRFLTEAELATAADLAGEHDGDLLKVTVGTGLRFSELGALWVSDVDLTGRTIRVSKAWKRNGEDGATDVPSWLKKKLRANAPLGSFEVDRVANLTEAQVKVAEDRIRAITVN